VNRHPHVFGEVKADTSAEVKRNWEALKTEERKKRDGGKTDGTDRAEASSRSILEGISFAMPSLLEAHKLSSRAAQIGFDWPNMEVCSISLTRRLQSFASICRNSRARSTPGRPRRGWLRRQTVPEALRERLEEE